LSHSEKNGRVLPIGDPELKSEIAAAVGLNCPQNPRGEYAASAKVAEGEELASNLLLMARVAWGIRGGLGVLGKGPRRRRLFAAALWKAAPTPYRQLRVAVAALKPPAPRQPAEYSPQRATKTVRRPDQARSEPLD
jgi:hypothetical protein